MKQKRSSKKLKSWSQNKQFRFNRDPKEAIEYLKSTFEENGDRPELVIQAIRETLSALGISIEQVAKNAKRSPSTIHKALSNEGNPTLSTLTAVLKSIGVKLSIAKAS